MEPAAILTPTVAAAVCGAGSWGRNGALVLWASSASSEDKGTLPPFYGRGGPFVGAADLRRPRPRLLRRRGPVTASAPSVLRRPRPRLLRRRGPVTASSPSGQEAFASGGRQSLQGW